MKKFAFLFPGQGAQYPGMGKDFYTSFQVAKETFQEADDLLSFHLSKIAFEGPEGLLTETRHSQCALFVVSVALLRTLGSQFPDAIPSICSGLSLGEYTALFASGRLSFAKTLALVQKRGALMSQACEMRGGTMAAVLGMEGAKVEEGLAPFDDVWIANYNAPGQIVISGTQEGVRKGGERLKELGAKRVLPLSVHGAFHSELMESARTGLAPSIEGVSLQKSQIELVMNVPGDFVKSDEEIRRHLIAQVTGSVRWQQGIEAIERRGVDIYLEIGAGKTLSGLNRKIGVKGATLSLEKVEDLESFANSASMACGVR